MTTPTQPTELPRRKHHVDAFSSVAFWQLMAFVILICFVWANEIVDLPHRVFGAAASAFSIYRASILTAAIIAAAVVAVGHTYERQRTIINKILRTCLYCHRVETEHGKWRHVEEYFMDNFPVAMDRSTCPDCRNMLSTVDSHKEAASVRSEKTTRPEPNA